MEPKPHPEYDFARSRTDVDHRAATAELAAAKAAWHIFDHRRTLSELYENYTQLRDNARLLIDHGHDEYRAEYAEAAARLDQLRADDELRAAVAPLVLGEELDCDPCRLGYSIVALRFDTDYWPTLAQIEEFMGDVFGFSASQVNQVMFDSFNVRRPRPALDLEPGADLAERMGYPLPPGEARWSDRYYVDAESHLRLGFHRIYADATYTTITAEEAKP